MRRLTGSHIRARQPALGGRLRKLRGEATLDEFCQQFHISPSYLCKLEAGKGSPSGALVELVSIKVGVSLEWLLGGDTGPLAQWKDDGTGLGITPVARHTAAKAVGAAYSMLTDERRRGALEVMAEDAGKPVLDVLLYVVLGKVGVSGEGSPTEKEAVNA